MLGSKSSYFHQDKAHLDKCALDMVAYLKLKGYSYSQINVYLVAFEYFENNPNEFDGATLVKDLCDLPGLDIDAMLHDFHYINCNVGSSFAMKWKADFLYAKGNERKGKSPYASCSRFAGLTLSGLLFIPFAILKRGKMSKEQKEKFLHDYKTLLK